MSAHRARSMFEAAFLSALFLLFATTALRAELRHWWTLDETSGLVAVDKQSGADGQLRGFPADGSEWITGVFHGGLDLGADPGNSWIDLTLPAMSAAETGGFTVMMWLRPGPAILAPGEYQVFSVSGDTVGLTIFNGEREGQIFDRNLLFWDTSLPNLTLGSTTLEPGVWVHVAITSTGAGGEKDLYVDGVKEVERLLAPSLGGADVATSDGWAAGPARIGSVIWGGRYHDAAIDDVRIYDRALSELEIQDIIDNPPPDPPAVTDLAPSDGEMFLDPATALTFTARSGGPGASIPEAGIQVIVNGADVSASLAISGDTAARSVVWDGLEAATTYDATIEVTDSQGERTRTRVVFGTHERSGEPDLRHWFPLDESAGRAAVDLAAGGYARLMGFDGPADSGWIDGIEAGGLDLGADAVADNRIEANVPEMIAFDTGGFTLALWVRPGEMVRAPGEYQLIFTPGDSVGVTIMNRDNLGQSFERVVLFWDGSGPDIVTSTTSLEPGTWYHVAVTSTGAGGERQIYINGQPEVKRPWDPAGIDTATSDGWPAGPLVVGAFPGARYHDSAIDDVRIWERALEADEIELLVGTPPARPPELANISPLEGETFHPAGDGVQFDVSTPNPGASIEAAGIELLVNGTDVSAELDVGGSPTAREVTWSGLAPGEVYDVRIAATDSAGGTVRHRFGFATLTPETEPGLRHRFRFDARHGLYAPDVAGGAAGRLVGFEADDDTQWVEGGRVGGALDLGSDETTDDLVEVEIPDMSAALTGGFTIALWIEPGEAILAPGEYQLFNAPGGGIGFTIMNATQAPGFDRNLLFWDGDANRIVTGSTTLEPGTWTHVAVTSTGIDGVRELWVDGVREEKKLWLPLGTDLGNSDGWPAGTAQIGGLPGGRWHESVIDDFRIYDTALEEAEIAALAEGGPPEVVFHRGDATGDGNLNITDGVFIFNFLFLGGPAPGCLDAADGDDSGSLNITDGIFTLNFLFLGGPPPPAPGPTASPCGADPTPEEPLDCASYEGC